MLPMAVAAAVLASCDRETPCGPSVEDGTEPISFITSGGFDYDIVTRSDMGTMMSDGFGLFGYNTKSYDFNPDSPSGLVIDNYRLTSDNGLQWKYADAVAYWNTSSDDKYTFLAYHPYDGNQGPELITVPSGPMKIDDCVDYIVAAPVMNHSEKGYVSLAFSHIFSKIVTTVKLGAAFEGQEYTLSSVEFKGVHDYPSFSLIENDFDRSSYHTHDISSGLSDIEGATMTDVVDVATVAPVYVSPYDYETKGKELAVNFTFSYKFTNKEGVVTLNSFSKEIIISKNLEGNKVYNLNVRFTPDKEGGVEMSVMLADYTESEDLSFSVHQTLPVNLSEHGTANCYIVDKGGKYCFDARYKGNSTVETVGEAVRAEVLWESMTGDVAEGDLVEGVGIEDDKVYFTASHRKGNALIAVKDASGTILWSWHIWLTDKPSDQTYRNNAGIVMDRNLGAVSAVREDGRKTYGLYYQWGRKDPFVPLDNLAGPNKSRSEGGQISSETAVRYPYVRYYKADRNWLTPADMKRWDTNGDGTGSKTINDPCPAGYRVPRGGGDGLWGTAAGGETFLPEYDRTYNGCDFGASNTKMCLTDEPACWYPVYGPWEISSISNHGVSYYLANACMNEMNMYALAINGYNYVAVSTVGTDITGPVRCVKE